MIRTFIINKYLATELIKVIINMSLIFFCLGVLMNVFEEINFFKDIDVGLYIPIALSLLYVPSLFYNMFPFIILLSGLWFFLKIKKTDEATVINVFGMSNFSIILIPSILSIILGIFFITSVNPITSLLVKKYETIKGSYERDKDYLAAITINGIWIKEINFFKDIDVGLYMPITLSLLYVPSLLYKMFPFIILLSGLWFFLKIKKTDEVTAINVFGMSNFSIILIPSILSIILGIFFITSINPITSLLVKKYETIKGSYERDKDYLAAITINGIWIKEKNLEINNIIRSASLEGEQLINVTIYEFDQNNNFTRRIEAESANISSTKWALKNVRIISNDGKILSENLKNYSHFSMYDVIKINSLYSNLDTISFWSIANEIKLLEERGYSTREMESKLQRSYAFPFFLLSMILLSSVFTLGVRFKENNWTYVFIAIVASVLIYFFNDFSAVLGKTGKLPIKIAVWMPIAIIFIFSAVGIIHANQK